MENKNTIEVSIEEFARLKDIETRFTILKNQMVNAEYCPIHTQVILGIEHACAKKQEIKTDLFPNKADKQEKELNADLFPKK